MWTNHVLGEYTWGVELYNTYVLHLCKLEFKSVSSAGQISYAKDLMLIDKMINFFKVCFKKTHTHNKDKKTNWWFAIVLKPKMFEKL